jgi:hypothetical protein
MRRSAVKGLWLAVAAASALALAAGASAARPLPSVHRLESHDGPVLALPFISPPPRLHRAMTWAHASSGRQLAMRFTPTQDRAVVGLEDPSDARAVAAAYGVAVVAVDPGLHMMQVHASPATLDRLAHAASWDGRLRFVEPLVERSYLRLHNDPALLQTDAATGRPFEWNFGATRADLALNLSKGSPRILVGIVDTGVTEVPDLRGKIAEKWFFNDQATSAEDTDGHGTAISSIIAATADDGVGIAGFGGAARIDMYRDRALNGFSDAVAIHHLVDRGVRIINLSFGGAVISQSEADALSYANAAGVLVIAATGNGGAAQVIWPARQLQTVGGEAGPGLAVGASVASGARADFSNYGPNLSLLAPGAFADGDCQNGIYVALPPVATYFDGNPCSRAFTGSVANTRYRYARGTSIAAPEVAGAAALIWAARPDLKSYEVASLLERGAMQTTSGWNPTTGWGVLDVARSLELATGRSAADRVNVARTNGAAALGAGKRLSVTTKVTWGDGAAVGAASITCTAAIDGMTLSPLSESLASGRASCTWPTPASAGGRTVTGTIAATEPQSGLSASTPFTTRLLDITRPTAQALPSPGQWGTRVPLLFIGSDETGSVSMLVRVFRNGRAVAKVSGDGASSIGWTAPSASTTDVFGFCVTATDKARNKSASSCAPILLQ